MGRGKTRLIKIEDDDDSSKSYSRRHANLVKKAFEMGTLSGVDVALVFFSKEGKLAHFSMHSRSIAGVISKFIDLPEEKRGMRIENPGYLSEILNKIKFDDARALLQQPAASSSDVKAKITELQTALNAKERKWQELLQRLRFFMPDRNAPTTSTFEEHRKETILTVLAQVKERKMKLIQQRTGAASQQECTSTRTSLQQQQYYQQAPPQQGYYATAPISQQHHTVALSPQICYNTTVPTQCQQYCNSTALPQQYCAPSSSWQQTIPHLQQHYSPSAAAPQQEYRVSAAPSKQEPIIAPPRYNNPTAPFQQEYCTSGTPGRHRTIAPLQQQHSISAPSQDDYHVPAPAKQEDNVVPIHPECTTSNVANDTMPPCTHFAQQSTDVHENNPSAVHQRNPNDNDIGSTLPRDTKVEVAPPLLDPNLPLDLEYVLNNIVKRLWQDDSDVPSDFDLNSFVDNLLNDIPDDPDDPDVP